MYRVGSMLSHGRRIGSSLPKWAIGLVIVTPTAAAIQGAYLLQDFRNNHLNAPIPVSPSRGIVVMKSAGSSTTDDEFTTPKTSRKITQVSLSMEGTRPLRLLVIGDSLAVGVGVLKQSTPILPESIAKALSEETGRAVSWTCVGTPGASSSQVVKDILSYEEDSDSGLLERKLTEWRATKKRAQEWFLRRHGGEYYSENNEMTHQKPGIAAAVEKIKRRWSRVRNDIESFHQNVIRKPEAETVSPKPTEQFPPSIKFNQLEVAPNEYDIAVVLTGLNDLKEVWLPWMMNRTLTKSTDGIKGELLGVLHALQQKMKLDFSIDNGDKSDNDKSEQDCDSLVKTTSVKDKYSRKDSRRRGPIVVFPAMPATPTHPFINKQPLSWFVVPLLKSVDNHKKRLAERFPNAVLYVESPSTSSMEDMEAGRGPIFDKRKAEEVLLSLTDITKKAKENIERLMKQHYERLTKDVEEGDSDRSDESTLHPPEHQYEGCNEPYDVTAVELPEVGATLMSVDNIHPNDEGYDFWGRHIAAAIVAEWKKKNDVS